MNAIFFSIVVIAFGVAAYRQLTESIPASAPTAMDVLGTGIIEAAKGSVTLALGLIGVMALFLGLMKLLKQAAS